MKKILILDIYKTSKFRQSKDTNGGFGTENNLGSGIFASALSRIANFSTFWPTLTSLNLISELLNAGYEVKYSKSYNDIDESISFIFVQSSIINFNHEINLIKFINRSFKKIKVFSFGAFASIVPNEYLLAGSSVIKGEAEFISQNYDLSDLNAIHEKKIINIINNNPDELTQPLWTGIHLPQMRNFIFSGSLKQTVPIIANRGCPYSCYEYCTYPLAQGRKVRSVDVEKLYSDIKYINKKTGTLNFVFRDPVFSINKSYTYKLLERLASLPKNFSFSIETHLNNINEDLINAMKLARINLIKFGIESASEDVMNDVSRYSIKHDDEIYRINLIKENKIKTHAMYILCQPSDTINTIDETINYSLKLNTNLAQFSLFTPYPGTPFYEKNKNLITSNNYEDFTQFNLVYKHNLFNNNDAHYYLGKAHKKFYQKKFFKI